MFHITPTPTSWIIWTGIFAVATIGILILGTLLLKADNYNDDQKYSDKPNNKKNLWPFAAGIIVIIVAAGGLAGMSRYYNYTHSSSYNMSVKNLKIEYDMDQTRTLEIYDFEGNLIYVYTGSFSYTNKGRQVELTDNKTGNKISVYMGDNDTMVVSDAAQSKNEVAEKTPNKSSDVNPATPPLAK